MAGQLACSTLTFPPRAPCSEPAAEEEEGEVLARPTWRLVTCHFKTPGQLGIGHRMERLLPIPSATTSPQST
ncbi:hypothetical protein E2C01_008075 [Portunus trituberculatus]|uniref:Uncharacterized protein n=1 Tax=Portunus trituberculatus TaxID=210409 RepID=A0A5B7D0T4_PORTR|nr:hypothetical protein [Portunus trituberculatus]